MDVVREPANLIYGDECYRIIGACFNVSKDKGHGFTEPIYQECLEIELAYQDIAFSAQAKLPLYYRGELLKHGFVPDFVCYGKIVLEIKAVAELTDEHRAQVLNYLNASGMRLGLLVNFGRHPRLEYERIVL